MKRILKFRIWAKGWKPTAQFVELKDLQIFGQKTIQDALDYISKNPDFICQEFTGMLDINGKEIYEGDIIQCVGEKVLCVVVFRQGCFGYIPYNAFQTLPIQKFIEVKGNVCEHSQAKTWMDNR